jgi:hypothetical protein
MGTPGAITHAPASDEVYKRINNDVYDQQAGSWWDENQCLRLLRSSVNPARAGASLRKDLLPGGFRVTGIDPSEQSLATARQRAQSMGLSSDYQIGFPRREVVLCLSSSAN